MKMIWMAVGPLEANCYILPAPAGKTVLVDPGDDAERIGEVLDKNGLTPAWILLTHGHHDHIGAVRALKARYPQVKVAIGSGDVELLNDTAKSLPFANLPKEEFLQEDMALKEGDEIVEGNLSFQVVETPGHTKGGVCYICRCLGEAEKLLFTGDTLFEGEIGRCDLYGGDYTAMLDSLRKLAALSGEYHVYPGHGGDTTLDRERRVNLYMKDAVYHADFD